MFPCCVHLTCHSPMGQLAPLARQEAIIVRKWLQPAGATAALWVLSLLPACPSSPFLFTHSQLSQFPTAVISSNVLCSCFFVFSCSLSSIHLSLFFLRACFSGEEVESGGGTERRQTRGGYTRSFMTNHMCFWVFVFTCFSWKTRWWKRMTVEERQPYGSCLLTQSRTVCFL